MNLLCLPLLPTGNQCVDTKLYPVSARWSLCNSKMKRSQLTKMWIFFVYLSLLQLFKAKLTVCVGVELHMHRQVGKWSVDNTYLFVTLALSNCNNPELVKSLTI